jgi:hypothetical protein
VLVAGSCGTTTGPVTVQVDGSAVTFRNHDGAWTVFTHCRRGRGTTVGPGYVARLVRFDGTVVTNDVRRPFAMNAPGFGGLGGFGFHAARQFGRAFDYEHAWHVNVRTCGDVGVRRSRLVEAPTVSEGIGRLTVDVFLADNRVSARDPLVRLRYRYRVLADEVRAAITVTELCRHGRCGWGKRAFVKEPKLVAAVNGGGYTRQVVLGAGERIARNRLERNRGRWACIWTGTNPQQRTGHCDADDRTAARFDFGPARRCAGRCLVVRMSAVGAPWESGRGLDGWALSASHRRSYATEDSATDGVRWSCKAHDTSNGIVRRWELGGGPKNAAGAYTAANFMFPAWEGGRGFCDCEPLSRAYGPRGESWTVLASYAFR